MANSDSSKSSPNLLNNFGNDFLSSIVVFLIALPLCLGIAIASGAPPMAGLISGIIGGVIVGSLAGCPLQVSGPAAGLIAVVWEIINNYGLENLGVFILLGGLIQIGIGLLRFAPIFQAVSPAVIHGMLAGIGVLIFGSQFHVMVDDVPRDSGIENLMSIPESFMKGVMVSDNTTHHIAAIIGVSTIAIMVFWHYMPKKIRILPSALVGVLMAVAASQFFKLPIIHVEIPDNPANFISFPDFSNCLHFLLDWQAFATILTIAFIASAETLLTATAVDKMHSGKRTNYNKEIIAQGIGNSIAGLIGALPITGVIVRSAANVQAGARTKNSAIFHGLLLLVFVLLFSFSLEMIPTSCLAAILVYTSVKLMNPGAVKELLKFGKSEVVIYAATVLLIVTTNLLLGVLMGIILSAVKLLYTFSHLNYRIRKIANKNSVNLHLEGCATFVNLTQLSNALLEVPHGMELHVKLDGLNYIDHAAFDLIIGFKQQYEQTGGSMEIEMDKLEQKITQAQTLSRSKNENAKSLS